VSALINDEQVLDRQTSSNTDNQYSTIEDIVQELEIDQIDDLLEPLTIEELIKTLVSCSKKKSPGPDNDTEERRGFRDTAKNPNCK
jgi:hypothetical protein